MDPKLKPLTKVSRAAVGLVVLVLLGMIGWSQRKDWIRSRVVSCTNHGHHIVMTMRVIENDGAEWEIPFLPMIEGHKLLPAFCIAEYGTDTGMLNCHHGASGFRRGGWQCVNLPKDRWIELLNRWEKSGFNDRIGADGVPFFWCGRPTGTGDRVCAAVKWEHERRWLNFGRVREGQLTERVAWLNRQLAELGEQPVALNIPGEVDWQSIMEWAKTVTSSMPRTRR